MTVARVNPGHLWEQQRRHGDASAPALSTWDTEYLKKAEGERSGHMELERGSQAPSAWGAHWFSERPILLQGCVSKLSCLVHSLSLSLWSSSMPFFKHTVGS